MKFSKKVQEQIQTMRIQRAITRIKTLKKSDDPSSANSSSKMLLKKDSTEIKMLQNDTSQSKG